MALLAATAAAVQRQLQGRLRPGFLAAVEDWRLSDCTDPARYPSPALAVNWSRDPRERCGSCARCRPEQRTPDEQQPWDVWLYLAGRGAGKTRSAAEDMAEHAALNNGWRLCILAPTYADARDTCVEGESGLQAVFTRWGWEDGREYLWNRSLGELRLRDSGSRFKLFSAEKPARLRGPQHHRAWVEEAAQVALHAPDAWDMMRLGLRLGRHPRVVTTTTPLPVKLIRDLLTDPAAVVTRGTTDDNARNLPAVVLRAFHDKYDGTRLGRQELGGELLEDIPGALWNRSWIDLRRIPTATVPGRDEDRLVRDARFLVTRQALEDAGVVLARIVVAVDPAVTSGEDADESGIVAVGLAPNGQLYVLEDSTLRDTPAAVTERLLEVYDRWEANTVVVEVNNGGEWIPAQINATLQLQGRAPGSVSVESIRAKKGKRVRAEPVSTLYEQGRVHHVGTHGYLEDQLCTWESSKVVSPDRMDALVYAVLHLGDSGSGSNLFVPTGTIGRHLGRAARLQMPTHSVRR